jgi:hypothetical protein
VTRTVQCSGCGRVRIGNVWTRDDSIKVTDVGSCPTCMDYARKAYRRKRAGEIRRLRQGKTGVAPQGDAFAALHYDAGDSFWRSKDVRAAGKELLGVQPVPPTCPARKSKGGMTWRTGAIRSRRSG